MQRKKLNKKQTLFKNHNLIIQFHRKLKTKGFIYVNISVYNRHRLIDSIQKAIE